MYAVVFHAHQKIDRIAYRHLKSLTKEDFLFPEIANILHFEGRNGPDATKFKNKTSVEAPWHFINPFDQNDTELHVIIDDHYQKLVKALKGKNQTRASFEAAWLAHALVDGLTPAHHYPYEAALQDLRGEDRNSRTSVVGHLMVKGETIAQSVAKSLKLIGPKGLLTTHTSFEAGVFTILMPLQLDKALPSPEDIELAREMGISSYFHRLAQEIAALDLYGRFYRTGWTPRLAHTIRKELLPRMVYMVTLAWYSALMDAEEQQKAVQS